MISDAKKGMFNQVCIVLAFFLVVMFRSSFQTGTMILMHELNDFTMSQAIKYYPKVKEVFDVGSFRLILLSPYLY